MMANISRAAVDVIDFMESMTMGPMPSPAPAKSPKTVGTMMSASTGVSFLVMISTMNTAIMANPSNTSTAGSFFIESHHPGVMRTTDVRVARVTAGPLPHLIGILLVGRILRIVLTPEGGPTCPV